MGPSPDGSWGPNSEDYFRGQCGVEALGREPSESSREHVEQLKVRFSLEVVFDVVPRDHRSSGLQRPFELGFGLEDRDLNAGPFLEENERPETSRLLPERPGMFSCRFDEGLGLSDPGRARGHREDCQRLTEARQRESLHTSILASQDSRVPLCDPSSERGAAPAHYGPVDPSPGAPRLADSVGR